MRSLPVLQPAFIGSVLALVLSMGFMTYLILTGSAPEPMNHDTESSFTE